MTSGSLNEIWLKATPLTHLIRPELGSTLVRVGSSLDGGYLISAELNTSAMNLISLGYGFNSDFEREFAKKPGTRVLLVDDVSNWIFYFKTMYTQILKHNVKMFIQGQFLNIAFKNWLNPINDWLKLRTNSKIKYINKRVVEFPASKEEVSFENLLGEYLSDQVDNMVKIDIEGSEYEILFDLLQHEDSVCGGIIEFHEISNHDAFFIDYMPLFRNFFRIDHVHVNNFRQPVNRTISTIEVSFTSRKLFPSDKIELAKLSKHDLDFPNTDQQPSIFLDFID
jgi:hypothetical protein